MIPVRIVVATAAALVVPGAASAEVLGDAAALDPGARFALSTFALLLGGAGAIMSVIGLSLRNAGLASARQRPATLLQILGAGALAFLLFYGVGGNLAFNIEPGGLLGSLWPSPASDETAPDADPAARSFFFACLAAIAAAIAAGAVAERARLWPQGLFIVLFAAVIFPIIVSWVWGGGYLAATWGFADAAGGAAIHVSAGAAAFAGALMLGRNGPARGVEGEARTTPLSGFTHVALGAKLAGAGLALATLGAAGPVQSTDDASRLAVIILNGAIAMSCAFATALVLTRLIYRKIDAAAASAGVIGAMAALAAAPGSPAHWQAALIGGIAAVIVVLGAPALERAGLDDPSAAVPTHLFCGAFGVLILPWYQESATILGQVAGLSIVSAFAFIMSALALVALRYTIGIRVGPETDAAGHGQGMIVLNAHRQAGLR